MTDAALRLVQAFPETPSVQLRLCDGLDAILHAIRGRLAHLITAVETRRREWGRVERLAALLADLDAGKPGTLRPFADIAEELFAEAREARPLRFLACDPAPLVARFVACHSLNVAQVVARVVRDDAEWGQSPIEPVVAALLCDAGMLRVPAETLGSVEPLTDERRRQIEGHAHAGADAVARCMPAAAKLAPAVAGHHERADGSGYPAGLTRDQADPLARLLAACDVYAAQCAPRPHRPALDPRTALADTLMLAETGKLDPDQAQKLLRLGFHPAGTVVELSDGRCGLVVANHPPAADLRPTTRPVVAVLTDPDGRILPRSEHLDLAAAEGAGVVGALSADRRRELLAGHYPELV
jgi:HD-GYP domain-containing protein (c-di-GMP phosphodiesterase class II)